MKFQVHFLHLQSFSFNSSYRKTLGSIYLSKSSAHIELFQQISQNVQSSPNIGFDHTILWKLMNDSPATICLQKIRLQRFWPYNNIASSYEYCYFLGLVSKWKTKFEHFFTLTLNFSKKFWNFNEILTFFQDPFTGKFY